MKSITRYMLGFIVAFMVVLPARGALPAAGDFVKVDDPGGNLGLQLL